MLINRDKRYVIITPPKTGSNSLNRLLIRPQFGASLYVDFWQHNAVLPPGCEGFRVFMSVRNPVTRAVSLYRQLARDDWGHEPIHPFDAFCRRVLIGHEVDRFFWSTLSEWAGGLDLAGVIRLESLREALAALQPDGPFAIPHENIDPALLPPEWYYSQFPDALAMVTEWGAIDAERFGYSMRTQA